MTESRKRAVLGSESLDFPSIAADGTVELAFAKSTHVGSARAGDAVALGSPAFLDVGLMAFAYVDANDDIVVRLHNTTGSAIDPSAGAQDAVAAEGTLTIAEDVTGEEASEGTLTIAEPVTDGDEFTIGTTVYTMKTTTAAAYDIAIGADEDATKVNIVAAINASGTEGVEYHAGTLIHPDVAATTFAGDAGVLTAKVEGVAGDSIVTAETGQGFTHASNIFDGATLGTTNAGVDGDTFTIGGVTYLFQETFVDEVNNVFAGANEAAAKVNLVAAINATGGTPGTTHFTSQVVNPDATAATFVGDDSVVTASTAGFAGNAIVSTETFAGGSNVFDALTLGDTTLGADEIFAEDALWSFALII